MSTDLACTAIATHSREEWLAARRLGIGGSDAAAVLGLSKWSSPLDVYLDKVGQAGESPDNEPMRWGRRLESVILDAYADATGRDFVKSHMLQSVERPWQLFTPDAFTGDFDRIIEVKTARTGEGWGEPGTDEVPEAYAIQVQHGMAVTQHDRADIAVLIGGSDFRIYTVERDDDLIRDLIEAEAAFWQRVERREPPPPRTYDEAQRQWGRSTASSEVFASAAAFAAHGELLKVRAEIDELETREAALKATICADLADRGDTLVGLGQTLATWKAAKPRDWFDAKAFAVAHPDLHRQFMRAGDPTRRLLIKPIKE